MPELDFTNADRDMIPCRVFDAAGNEHAEVVRCDTGTGIIEKHRPNGRGGVVVKDLCVVTDIVQAPAPLEIKVW